MDETGFCPNCGLKGRTSEPCPEKVCQRHGYHLIPEAHYEKVEVVHADPNDPLIGRMIGEYLVVDQIGAGGFGTVYLALQTPILMKSALKLMGRRKSDSVSGEEMANKFRREAAALASLTHPNVVRLLKFGVHVDRPYLVMEYVEGGRTLKEEISRLVVDGKRMDSEIVPHIFRQILNALDAAHSKQIIHRDIKPDNIMLQEVHGDSCFVKVLDFGLAKFTEQRTDTSILMGTPVYMAPEQITKKEIGPWTDLYAVGVMLFELVTGRRTYARAKDAPADPETPSDTPGVPPLVLDSLDEELQRQREEAKTEGVEPQYGGNTTQQILLNKLDPDYDPTELIADLDLPENTVAFFRKALAKESADRFPTTGAFRESMEGMFEELGKAREHAVPIGKISGLVDSTEIMRVRLERDRLQEEKQRLLSEKKELSRALEEVPTLPDTEGGKHRRFNSRWLIVSVFILTAVAAILGLYHALKSAEETIEKISGNGQETAEFSRTAAASIPKPPRLGLTPEGEARQLAAIDDKLAEGRTDDAEPLLDKCMGAGCLSRWNSLAVVYESRNDHERAQRAYRRLFELVRTDEERQRIMARIEALNVPAD